MKTPVEKLPPYPYITPISWENSHPVLYHVKLSPDAPLLVCIANNEIEALAKAEQILKSL